MNREILRLAIPNILSNISIPLLSTVDTALMGQLPTPEYLAAVALGVMFFNTVYWSFAFLRMGTTGMSAQAYGAGMQADMALVFYRALLLAMIGAVLMLLSYPLLVYILQHIVSGSPEVKELAQTYIGIRLLDAPAALTMMVLTGWFLGLQNAWIPLLLTLLVNVLNIILNIVLVHYYGMHVAGVAWGTVIAQYTGVLAALAIMLYFRRFRDILKTFNRQAIFVRSSLGKFLDVNRDIFIRSAMLTAVFALFVERAGQLGVMELAVHTLLIQFVHWASFGIDGFAHASESLVGKYTGGLQHSRRAAIIKRCFVWGFGLSALYVIVYFFLGDTLIRMLTSQENLQIMAYSYLPWLWIIPVLATPAYLWDGVFVGLTAAKAMRNSMFLAFGVFILIIVLMLQSHGLTALWLAMTLFLLTRGLVQSIQYAYYHKKW